QFSHPKADQRVTICIGIPEAAAPGPAAASAGAPRRRMSGGGSPAAPSPALSGRGARIAGAAPGLLDEGFALYLADPFDRQRNPEGVLNLGTSGNALCFDLIEERVSAAAACRAACRPLLGPVRVTAEHGSHLQGRTPESPQIYGYLIPAPYYGGINSKMWLYGELQPVHVPLFSEVTFWLFVYFNRHFTSSSPKKKKSLILINPHNPLGDIYPAQLLKECLEFAHRYELHVIMDEIYMLSVYGDVTFTSVLSLESKKYTSVFFLSSKDFGMSGIRVGVLYTRNHEIQKAVNQLAVFHSCPGPVQHVLSQFLKDRDWMDNVFFPTNKKRLKEAQNLLVDGLADIGVPVLKSSGGLYVWADFRKFLKSQTFEAELELWQKLLDKKLLISPGKAFCCYEPGWFRLVFSNSVDKIYLCKGNQPPFSISPSCQFLSD
uniref:Aminotransferase class I/classII large domain-containing protein n=1 Tax=Anser brachyrhynchus TaxID=132585 RepID=A0A8B9BVB8_9AVES